MDPEVFAQACKTRAQRIIEILLELDGDEMRQEIMYYVSKRFCLLCGRGQPERGTCRCAPCYDE